MFANELGASLYICYSSRLFRNLLRSMKDMKSHVIVMLVSVKLNMKKALSSLTSQHRSFPTKKPRIRHLSSYSMPIQRLPQKTSFELFKIQANIRKGKLRGTESTKQTSVNFFNLSSIYQFVWVYYFPWSNIAYLDVGKNCQQGHLLPQS